MLAGRSCVVPGADAVAAQAATFSQSGLSNHVVLVNGSMGIVSRRPDGPVFSVLGFTIAGSRIVEINSLADRGATPSARFVRYRELKAARRRCSQDAREALLKGAGTVKVEPDTLIKGNSDGTRKLRG